ncbi:tRNA-Val4 [Virgibacillus dakarensis]|nr:tRNA-Val4 [Virgibacillus dakarensis]
MKYSYQFKEGPYSHLQILLPEEITLFSDFIELITTPERADEFIGIIDNVLDRTYEDYEITYNAPSVFIQPDITTVSNEFLIEPPFKQNMETKEFRELILIWRDKLTGQAEE